MRTSLRCSLVAADRRLHRTTHSYKIPATELQRLAVAPPEQRGQHVRVIQEIGETDVGPAYPVDARDPMVIIPQVNVYGQHERRRSTHGGSGGIGASGGRSVAPAARSGGGHSFGSGAARPATARPRRWRS